MSPLRMWFGVASGSSVRGNTDSRLALGSYPREGHPVAQATRARDGGSVWSPGFGDVELVSSGRRHIRPHRPDWPPA